MRKYLYTKKLSKISTINVVPYIDVMLVLLIIFMVTTPILHQGVVVDLPKAKAESLNLSNFDPVIITVDRNGSYYLDRDSSKFLGLDELVIKVIARIEFAADEGEHNLPVFIKGDEKVNYAAIMNLMSVLNQAGITKVGLLTRPPINEKLS